MREEKGEEQTLLIDSGDTGGKGKLSKPREPLNTDYLTQREVISNAEPGGRALHSHHQLEVRNTKHCIVRCDL